MSNFKSCGLSVDLKCLRPFFFKYIFHLALFISQSS